jgi:hypothetical protein
MEKRPAGGASGCIGGGVNVGGQVEFRKYGKGWGRSFDYLGRISSDG